MKKYFLFSGFCFLLLFAKAQTQFFSTVKIEFEKTVTLQALYKEIANGDSWYENMKDQIPKTSLRILISLQTAHTLFINRVGR